jgi:hypothetical protein
MGKINMKILNQKMTDKKFISYIYSQKWRPWDRKITRIIMHHTSSPIESWKNSGSMLHYYNLYNSRGWKAGPHIFIAPNGIWLFTPIKKEGKCSANIANKGSIHIEIVGRYFNHSPENESIRYLAGLVAEVLLSNFGLKEQDIFTHYSFDSESNCSPWVGREWLKACHKEYKELIHRTIYENTNFAS